MSRLLRAELTKLTTTRMLMGFALGLVGLMVVTGVLPIALSSAAPEIPLDQPELQRQLLASGSTAGTFALLLGIVSMAGEGRHGTLTPTFLATPRRPRVVAAKAVVMTAVGMMFGVVSATLGVGLFIGGLQVVDVPLVVPTDVIVRIVWGTVVYAALSGAFGVGLGAVIPNQITAIVTAIVVLVVADPLLVQFIPAVGRWLPGGAAQSLVASPTLRALPQYAGGLLYAAYAALTTVVGAALVARRDVA